MRTTPSAFAAVIIVGSLLAVAVRDSRPRETAPALRQATFAAGCFWGVEAAFRKTHGVTSTIVGYTGGHTDRPTYREISLGNTGHAEAVLVTYDPRQVSYSELLDVFWNCHDPTIDRAGGPHASVIFFHDGEQEATARASLDEVARSNWFKGAITTQIVPAGPFYPAEAYHQQYLAAHGDLDACHTGPAVIRTLLASRAAAARSAAGAQPAGGPE